MSKSKNGEKGRITLGVLAALVLTAVLCGIYALLIKSGKCGYEHSTLIVSAAVAISVFISAMLSNRGRTRRCLYGIIIGALFATAICAVPVIAYPTELDWLKTVRLIAVSVVSGFLGGAINLGKSNKSFHCSGKKKNRYNR